MLVLYCRYCITLSSGRTKFEKQHKIQNWLRNGQLTRKSEFSNSFTALRGENDLFWECILHTNGGGFMLPHSMGALGSNNAQILKEGV
jgi:hypothetical protein